MHHNGGGRIQALRRTATGVDAMQLSLRTLFQPTVLLAMALMAVIIMMILPAPAWVVDIGLTASFALAILIFTITLFIERPLDFSSFPTVLLASLLLDFVINLNRYLDTGVVRSITITVPETENGEKASANIQFYVYTYQEG